MTKAFGCAVPKMSGPDLCAGPRSRLHVSIAVNSGITLDLAI